MDTISDQSTYYWLAGTACLLLVLVALFATMMAGQAERRWEAIQRRRRIERQRRLDQLTPEQRDRIARSFLDGKWHG